MLASPTSRKRAIIFTARRIRFYLMLITNIGASLLLYLVVTMDKQTAVTGFALGFWAMLSVGGEVFAPYRPKPSPYFGFAHRIIAFGLLQQIIFSGFLQITAVIGKIQHPRPIDTMVTLVFFIGIFFGCIGLITLAMAMLFRELKSLGSEIKVSRKN